MSETIGRALILGTAGHIDHGKTALVKALTGIDADRLPEEQQRGMTIDLGFAHLELGGKKIGIVDVPGHERFIRNMVAGATGIDLVMLLVAADDSVMPQTREHLEIIDLLGVRGGLVALSKIDLASEEKILSAEAGVRELTRGTCLEGCPIIRVSAITGEGVAMLRDAIEQQIQNLDLDSWPPLFRLPIDRRFSLKGHGTVVTGSLLGGDVAPSDEVELMPQGRKVRVRSAQSHGSQREGLESGRRVALNVAGLRTRDVKRGDELAAPGFLRPSSRLLVRLRCLRSAPLVIDSHQTFRLHIGTQNVDGQFALIGAEELEPGQSVYGLLRTKAEVCAVHGQRFIVRSSSHGVTIGGGEVLCTNPPRLKLSEGEPDWIATLHDGSERDRLLTMLEIEPSLGGDLRGLYRETGVTPESCERLLRELADAGEIRRSPGPKGSGFWTNAYIERTKAEVLKRLKNLLEKLRPRISVDHGALIRATGTLGPAEFVAWILGQLEEEGKIVHRDNRYQLLGHEVKLSETDRMEQEKLLALYESAGCAPPRLEAASVKAGLTKSKAETLYAHAIDTGRLVEINKEITLHASRHRGLLETLGNAFQSEQGLTVSRIKDLLGVSRKFAIPICEYLDRKGYTRRQGDLRYEGKLLAAKTQK